MDQNLRRETIELELQGYEDRKDKRRESIEIRGEKTPLEVVRVNLDVPLLNHDNSRLRAQLSTHSLREKVQQNPTSQESQEVLTTLLRQTAQYKALCEQLEDMGQMEPGVITRDGMLVDGNTRLVALRDSGVGGIDVAVLPITANDNDFFDIEMSIQLRKLVHRDYTYTNLLLLVKSLTERFESNEAIFNALGWKKDGERRLERHLRWLSLVEEIRRESEKDYIFFDDKAELIKNLDEAYQSLLQSDPSEAENLKWNRIFSLVLGLNKDEVRAIDETFVSAQISQHLPGSDAEPFFEGLAVEDSGSTSLAGLLGQEKGGGQRKYDMKLATKRLLALDEGDESRGAIFRDFKSSARAIIERKVKEEIRTQPLEYLDEIADKVDELARNLPIYFEDEKWDAAEFSDSSFG